MSKITPAEFKKWTGWFWETSLSALNSTNFKEGKPEKQKKAKELISFMFERIKVGCPYTILQFCEGIRAWYKTGFITSLRPIFPRLKTELKRELRLWVIIIPTSFISQWN